MRSRLEPGGEPSGTQVLRQHKTLRADQRASLRIPNESPCSPYDILTSRELRSERATRDKSMTDLVYIAICAGFFAVAIAYTYACDKLRGEKP